jgi:hypothetical protein
MSALVNMTHDAASLPRLSTQAAVEWLAATGDVQPVGPPALWGAACRAQGGAAEQVSKSNMALAVLPATSHRIV